MSTWLPIDVGEEGSKKSGEVQGINGIEHAERLPWATVLRGVGVEDEDEDETMRLSDEGPNGSGVLGIWGIEQSIEWLGCAMMVVVVKGGKRGEARKERGWRGRKKLANADLKVGHLEGRNGGNADPPQRTRKQP